MNAFKIWIATHPDEADNREVSLIEPRGGEGLYSEITGEHVYVDWVEHVCIPIQE
jgi:hypothetical protein